MLTIRQHAYSGLWVIVERVGTYQGQWLTIEWPMKYETKESAIMAAKKGLY